MNDATSARLFLAFVVSFITVGVSQPVVVNFDVNTTTGKGVISPLIYGTNVLHNFPVSTVDNLYPSIPARRFGGDRVTGYNWENNYSNGGSYVCDQGHWQGDVDYCNQSDDALPFFHQVPAGDYRKSGSVLKAFHDLSVANNSYSLIQLPMAGYVARDGNGKISAAEAAPSNRWIQVVNTKGAALTLTPDQNDANLYVDEEMNYLLQSYGNSTSARGVKGYELDNEPDIWNAAGVENGRDTGTHPKLFPRRLRVDAFLTKTLDLAKTIKRMDPSADVHGPAFANYYGYYSLHNAPDWGNYAGQYPRFVDLYLARMKEYSQAEGKRLLDVFTLHWYSQENGIDSPDRSQDVVRRRLQAPRSLWDNTYKENSWITDAINKPIEQIPDLQRSIDQYYPGTKIGFTEWRFGMWNTDQNDPNYNSDHISIGIATVDALGIFGKYGVYFATFFERLDGYAKAAFLLYRNYDGNGGKFGSRKIFSSTNDVEKSSIYASMNDNDSEMHFILLNKTSGIINGRFAVTSDKAFRQEVKVFEIVENNPSVQARGTINIVNTKQFTYNLPPFSATHLVFMTTATKVTENTELQKQFSLEQNYPNPVRISTEIKYNIPVNSHVVLTVKNIFGEEVATLVDEEQAQGSYCTSWNGRMNLSNYAPNGIYIFQLKAKNVLLSRKMALIR